MTRVGIAVAAVLLFGLAGGAGGATPSSAELVFSSSRAPDYHDEVYVLDTRTGGRRNVSRNATTDGQPAISPDRRTIAFASNRGGRGEAVWITPASGGALRRLHAPLPGRIAGLEWSADGRWIAFQLERSGGLDAVYVVSRVGGRPRLVATRALNMAWLTARTLAVDQSEDVTVRSLEGRVLRRHRGALGAASARGELALFATGRIEIVASDGRRRAIVRGFGPFAWSRDGSRLAYSLASNGPGIAVVDRTGSPRVLSRKVAFFGGWAPDGRSVLARDARTFRPVRVSLDGKVASVGVENGVWSRTGAALVGTGADGRLAIWRPGTKPRPLTAQSTREPCPSFSSRIQWLDDRRVVVQLGRGGQQDADLWTSDRTGARFRRVRRSLDWAEAPEWSPDGSRVVYESGSVHTHAGGCSGPMTPHLRIVSPDGSGDRVLTQPDDGHFQQAPRWSPDGMKVAFHRKDISELSEFGVFVVDVASRATRRLTTGYGEGVSWSPDGGRLAFSGRGVSVANLGTGAVTRIAPGERAEWSPDGSLIAHVRGAEVWVVKPDGTDARRVSDARPVDDLRWSRNGSRLAFGSAGGIRIVDSAGRTVRTIAQPGARSPRFSRDGRLIAFVAASGPLQGAFGAWTDLYVADVAGGPARRITHDYAGVGAPSWR
jgi:Tol biopolymer transport system component